MKRDRGVGKFLAIGGDATRVCGGVTDSARGWAGDSGRGHVSACAGLGG